MDNWERTRVFPQLSVSVSRPFCAILVCVVRVAMLAKV